MAGVPAEAGSTRGPGTPAGLKRHLTEKIASAEIPCLRPADGVVFNMAAFFESLKRNWREARLSRHEISGSLGDLGLFNPARAFIFPR